MNIQADADTISLSPIRERYLLIIEIPVLRDALGRRFVDALWHKDLMLHLDYIENFSLACPCIDGSVPSNWVEISDRRIRFIDLPSRRKLSLRLPRTVARLWHAIGEADVVHSILGGWLPISVGNMVALFARTRRKYLLIIVESSPWRLVPGVSISWLQRMRASLAELMNRWCINQVDLGIFTQAAYKADLMRERPERGHVIHASWIDEGNLVSDEEAAIDWRAKQHDHAGSLKVLFAGRLTAAKGVASLLDAIDVAESEGLAVHLSILGQGDLTELCAAAGARQRSTTRVQLWDNIPYGSHFFSFVRKFDAVVVPSLTDEQPRIVYDAYSQAVPVLASDTAGLRDCVVSDETGLLFTADNERSILGSFQKALHDKPRLAEMGLAGLQRARALTHRAMHRQRWVLLDNALGRRVGVYKPAKPNPV